MINKQLTEAITQGFHAAGFNFREGEWDMERAVAAMAPPIQAFLTQQAKSPLKKTRAECALSAHEVNDEIYISGHVGVATLAFKDIDTDRWYFIDICENCGHPEVGFTDRPPKDEAKNYPVVTKVGGYAAEPPLEAL